MTKHSPQVVSEEDGCHQRDENSEWKEPRALVWKSGWEYVHIKWNYKKGWLTYIHLWGYIYLAWIYFVKKSVYNNQSERILHHYHTKSADWVGLLLLFIELGAKQKFMKHVQN